MINSVFRNIAIPAILILVLFLAGCTAIRSVQYSGNSAGSGLRYYLPKGKIDLSVVQEITTPAPQLPAAYQTNTFVTNQWVFHQFSTGTESPTFNNGLVSLDLQGVKGASNVVCQTQTIQYSSPSVTPTTGAAPTGPTTNYFISAHVRLVTDNDNSYLLQLDPSAFADDSMQIGVSNGLLQTVSLTNTDQTLTIFSNLAQSAVEFANVASAASSPGTTVTDITNIFTFDPFDAGQCANLKKRLIGYGIDIDFSSFKPIVGKPASKTSGIFYRQLQEYDFTWDTPASGSGAVSVYLPNASPVDSLDVSRATFVSQTYSILIHDGIPLQVNLNKPSQFAAASLLPVVVANDLISIPLQVTNLLQAKVNIQNIKNQEIVSKTSAITNLINYNTAVQQLNNNPNPNKNKTQTAGGAGGG